MSNPVVFSGNNFFFEENLLVILFFTWREGSFRRRLGGENSFLNKTLSFLRNAMSQREFSFAGIFFEEESKGDLIGDIRNHR